MKGVSNSFQNNPIPAGMSALVYSFKEAVKQSKALGGACKISWTKQFELNDEQRTVFQFPASLLSSSCLLAT